MKKYAPIDLFWLSTSVMAGMLIGNLLGLVFLLPSLDYDFSKVEYALSSPSNFPEIKVPLILLQGVTAFFSFILFPYLYSKLIVKNTFDIRIKLNDLSFLLPIFTTIFALPIISLFIEWNSSMILPDFLSEFENWAKIKEESLKELTEYLTNLTGYKEFILGIIVFSILPGIGEEYLFRGIIQKYFSKWMNIHVAIWLAAILFSAIHFQFYGFLPRMILGVLFGYMYWWSENLLVPILAHATNNAFTLILVFLNNHKYINIDLESADNIPWYIILISGIVFVFLLFGSYKLFTEKKNV